jgi:carboxymethylenebutenolidase
MGQQLAGGGYLVLMPDLYYRSGPYPPMVPSEVFADPAQRDELMKKISSLDRERKISDTAAFIEYLSSLSDVSGERIGVVGYCMCGNIALTAAGAFPDHIAAAASFHGGNLATDQPDSPHLFVGRIIGKVYVAGAVEDTHFDDVQKARLEQALTVAGLDHVVESYEGAHHGFAVPDVPSYDPAAAERHWKVLFELFGETLNP